jgi:regulator of RNase E activity RraA
VGIWTTDDELFRLAEKELFTCVVGDVMDKMHTFHQFLPPEIRPLDQKMVLIGRAMPVLSGDVYQESVTGSANKLMEKPFGLMLEALDDLKPNEIYVSTGSAHRNAMWGELMVWLSNPSHSSRCCNSVPRRFRQPWRCHRKTKARIP